MPREGVTQGMSDWLVGDKDIGKDSLVQEAVGSSPSSHLYHKRTSVLPSGKQDRITVLTHRVMVIIKRQQCSCLARVAHWLSVDL